MASVDAGSLSLRASSDEVYDHICEPCSTDGVDREAKHYCNDCRQKICDACRDYHRKFAGNRNHTIVPVNKGLATASGNQGMAILCGCNKNQQVTVFCETHRDVICSPCKSFQHHNCNTSTIKEKSSGYKSSTFESLLSQTKSLNDKYEQLKKENDKIDSERKELKITCIKEIKAFRNELDTFLDRLEKNMLAELDQWERDEIRRVKQNLSALAAALGLLQIDLKLLDDVKRDGRKESMYTADVQVSKTIQGYEKRLRELENARGKPTLTFERNKSLADLKAAVQSLGCLKPGYMQISHDHSSTKTYSREKTVLLGRTVQSRSQVKADEDSSTKTYRREKTVLLGRTVQSSSKVKVKADDDKRTPSITGCTVMANGDVVLCDRNNNKIKLLNSSGVFTGNLLLSSYPRDVSVLDSTSIIVTLPGNKQLQVVQVYPQLKPGKVIQLDKHCWGVAVVKDELYVTCHNGPGEGEIRVLGLDGKVKRRLGVNQDGSFMFTSPYHITVNQSGVKIVVSDRYTDTITCMSVDGRVIYAYKDNSLREPRGLLCDSEDNILVCGWWSNNVQVLTADGKRHSNLLTASDGLNVPCSIAYRDSDNTLLVGCEDNNTLSFQLSK